MPVPEYAHDYKALMQDMAPAFEGCKEYTLVDSEVGIVYLSLIRLQALEEAAMKRDWETVALYTPDYMTDSFEPLASADGSTPSGGLPQ